MGQVWVEVYVRRLGTYECSRMHLEDVAACLELCHMPLEQINVLYSLGG